MSIKGRWFIRVAICSIAFSSLTSAQSLRNRADNIDLLVGTAVNPVYLSEPAYALTLAREFNMVEAEDAMKWGAIRPSEKTFDFKAADQIVGFALTHRMKIRGHNLVWWQYNPEWLSSGHYTPEQLSQLLQDHITKTVSHFRGKVFAWDVVNEAFDENGKLRNSIWYNQPGIGMAAKGTAYIEQAFRWAHAADPQALLFYNEAEGEAINAKSDAIYAMVKDFRRRGVPIDGIGLQMHILDLNPNVESISANIARLTKLGVQVQITEMDVAVPIDSSGKAAYPADLLRQAEIYKQIANVCVKSLGCTAFQTWGFTDKYSWLGWFTGHTKAAGLLFDDRYQPKPAYGALKQVLEERASQANKIR